MATEIAVAGNQTRTDERAGVVSSIGTWLRRPRSWVEIVAWAALAVFVVITLGAPLLGHGTFLNTGLLDKFAPWNSVAKSLKASTNGFDTDTIDSAAPQVSLLVRAAHAGVFAQWNPYISGGTELGGIPDSGAYSPLSLPWWILPLTYAPGMVKLLEIVVVTIGMALLLRRFGVPRAAWPIASLVFVSSGFMVAWTNWPQTRVAAFIPLLFWAVDRAAVELKKRDIISVGIALSCMLLGGFPAVVGYTLFVGGIYFMVRTIIAHRALRGVLLSVLLVVCGLVFGALLTAWQLVPFALNALSVVDFGAREQSGSMALGIQALVTSWVPDAQSDGSLGGVWGAGNPVEIYSYVGMAAVVLIAAAIVMRPRIRKVPGVVPLLVGLLIFSVILVYVGGPILSVVRHLPVYDSNPVGRMRCDVGFFVALLAGIGFGRLVEPENLRDEFVRLRTVAVWRRVARVLSLVVAIAGGLWIAYQTRITLLPISATHIHQVKVSTTWAAAIALLTVIAIGLAWILRNRYVGVVAAVGVIVMVTVPAISSVQSWWPVSANSTFYPTTPALSYLKKHLTDQQRYATSGQATLPGSATFYRLRSLTGHTFQTQEWKDLMTTMDPAAELSQTYSSFRPTNLNTTVTAPLLERLAVRYVVSSPSDPLLGTVEPGAAVSSYDSLTRSSSSVDSGPESGPLNGIQFTGPPAQTASKKGFTLKVAIVADGSGKTLASTSTWVGSLGGRRAVAIAGDSIPASTSWHATISVSGIDSASPVKIGTTSSGSAPIDIVRPNPVQNVRVVHTGDATIYEIVGADQRVHWASRQTVLTKTESRLVTLQDPTTPHDEVVLSHATSHSADSTGTAKITVDSSDVNATVVHVNATKSGWVVVEDSLQRPGWSATIDGTKTKLVAADEAGGAVWVPAGAHTVDLQYSTPGFHDGVALTVASIVGAIVVTLVLGILGRRRRRGSAARRTQ